MKPTDFLVVGDVATDTFIKLRDGSATIACDAKGEACTFTIPWGQKITYDFAVKIGAVGNAGNAAMSAARLGLTTEVLCTTGKDAESDLSVAIFKENGVSTDLFTQVEGSASNHHFALWYGEDRTIFRKHNVFPYTIPTEQVPPPFVYLSSLGDETGKSHTELLAWLARYPDTKLVFQPGREISMPREVTAPIFQSAYLSICNKEEAESILGLPSGQDMRELLMKFAALGTKIVIITNGPKGACAYDGKQIVQVPAYPDPKPPYERTGAGDAFSSTVAAALALGKPLEEALLWGPVNAMSKVQKIGGHEGLLSRTDLEAYLAKAPADYKITKL